jgi:hypothetical protein
MLRSIDGSIDKTRAAMTKSDDKLIADFKDCDPEVRDRIKNMVDDFLKSDNVKKVAVYTTKVFY